MTDKPLRLHVYGDKNFKLTGSSFTECLDELKSFVTSEMLCVFYISLLLFQF